jgi:hypothetical protein
VKLVALLGYLCLKMRDFFMSSNMILVCFHKHKGGRFGCPCVTNALKRNWVVLFASGSKLFSFKFSRIIFCAETVVMMKTMDYGN